ncbi:hypothetical protein H7347_06860 [Corynebacterium sp. zg-331]|uniref:hypothetical protein n=1 Tax=unclassified Corynebacterium TaxID=2624378 RepID=UPI00128BE355|nr:MULTISPECIES: hypothetical protein [unclassified Corynebacterium]MBC3186292.1 hypothetical protein [Corynebacterium sp. zg-331]MPV52781.1 hypothetical protein [Corynebacterium sp. zg331]
MSPFVPLRQTVEVYTPTVTTNRFGDQIAGPGHWETHAVAGWAINSTQEETGDSALRTTERLLVYMDANHPAQPADLIRLPDNTTWEVQGHPQRFDNGPWWQPGLVTITCTKTEG